MTELKVFVSGPWNDSRLLTLPIDVYAPSGIVLARGIVSPNQPAQFQLPELSRNELGRVYVLGKLPNGVTIQQTVELRGGKAETTLQLSEESPHEWLQWVTPFRSLNHLQSSKETALIPIEASRESNSIAIEASKGSDAVAPRRIGKVWMTLWSLIYGRWEAQWVRAIDQQRDNGMQQLVIDVPLYPHLLQIGGEEVAWRLVSLPPGGPVRVALTRSATDKGDSVEITVGRSKPDNELIMSYLARGAIAEAYRLADAWHVEELMPYVKNRDPVSAAAGAYLLFKSQRPQYHQSFVDMLARLFPCIADTAIVAAALALRRDGAKESEVRSRISLALDRGLPIFAMGAAILVETMAAVHRGKRETKRFHQSYLAAQAYERAHCSSGAYFAFYGKSPAEPSWTPIYGLEGKAAASPGRTESVEAVVFARPLGGIKTGKFGNTRVALPRAPVSAEMLKKLRVEARHIDEERTAEPTLDRELLRSDVQLFQNTLELGMPLVETAFLQEFSVGSDRGPSPVTRHAQAAPRDKPQGRLVRKKSTNQVRRQTANYWREERLRHATTLFDGDE